MVLIESSPQLLLVFENQLFDTAQIMCSDSTIVGESDVRLEPEFSLAVGSADVVMSWLMSFVRIKVKPK